MEICIIGGGFTGIAAAVACLDAVHQPFGLTIVEPSTKLGRGIAFGGHHPLHLLNVRARDLSVRADRPGDFLNWAFAEMDQGENEAALHEGLAHAFLPRQLFGEYVRQRFFETLADRADVAMRQIRNRAVATSAVGNRYAINIDRGHALDADVVILATAYGLQQPAQSGALGPYEPLPRERLESATSLALIGGGLTMADVLMGARRGGFTGTATIISRRAQLPRPHAPQGVVPHEMALPPSKRIAMLTAAVRLACQVADDRGTPWQAVINAVRPAVQDIWRGLSREEQARFLRHLRPFWDTHRHRLPIDVHRRIMAELDNGRAVLLQARAEGVERREATFRVKLRRQGRAESHDFDLAFDCAGHRPDIVNPLLESLCEQGLTRPDSHGLGLAVEPDGAVIGKDGVANRRLFALGPLGFGSLLEITAVPEIVQQASLAAKVIALEGSAAALC